METVQQNGRFTLFSSKFHSNIYSILCGYISIDRYVMNINPIGGKFKAFNIFTQNEDGKKMYSFLVLIQILYRSQQQKLRYTLFNWKSNYDWILNFRVKGFHERK